MTKANGKNHVGKPKEFLYSLVLISIEVRLAWEEVTMANLGLPGSELFLKLVGSLADETEERAKFW